MAIAALTISRMYREVAKFHRNLAVCSTLKRQKKNKQITKLLKKLNPEKHNYVIASHMGSLVVSSDSGSLVKSSDSVKAPSSKIQFFNSLFCFKKPL